MLATTTTTNNYSVVIMASFKLLNILLIMPESNFYKLNER